MYCRICKKENNVKSIRSIKSPFIDLTYKLYECSLCRSKFFNSDEYDINLHSIYNDYYKNQNPATSFIKDKYWENQVKIIKKILGHKPQSVLDAGCKTGDFLMHFPDNIIREGVELSDSNYYSVPKVVDNN
ncbi:MAG: class I SAM-dependent methyltransferase [bacterium]|nr:class I SAM-dependent methyltransferase [bacterium]